MSTITDTDQTSADQDERRLVVTLTAGPAGFARRLATRMNVSVPEVMRRALSVLDLVMSLEEDEELVIRNRRTKQTDRVRFQWGIER
jgi:hypothetical protein